MEMRGRSKTNDAMSTFFSRAEMIFNPIWILSARNKGGADAGSVPCSTNGDTSAVRLRQLYEKLPISTRPPVARSTTDAMSLADLVLEPGGLHQHKTGNQRATTKAANPSRLKGNDS